jgi:hypothetical protein
MFKRNKKAIAVLVFIFIVISNLPPIQSLFDLSIDQDLYKYSSCDGAVTFQEITYKNRDYKIAELLYSDYMSKHKNIDCKFYRLFQINPFAFWRWRYYLFDKRYRLEYKNWNNILKVRGKITNKTGYQDF